jgi:excisionase family DNA binding protein
VSDRLKGAIRELVAAIREEIAAASKPDSPVLLFGVDEAARRLGISRTTLYGELAAGRVRSLKVGRRRVIPVDALAEYVHRMSSE